MKKLFCLLFSFYFLFFVSLNLFAVDKDAKKAKPARKISINSAQYTEYKKVPARPYTKEDLEKLNKKDTDKAKSKEKKVPKDELIIFTGTVSISVSDDSSTSTIKADKIIYNKTRKTLTAIGAVFYERKVGSSSGETFSGDYLIFNIEKLEGVFLDGVIEQAATKKGREPFRIHTDIAGRDESGTIAFKDALLTTSKDEEPLWSIRASRLWILPGNEMAFANGFLSVGVVPLIYMPFFYYPADVMLLNPVFGYRNREGSFVQTTTYLYGRKPAPKSEGGTTFSNFMQSDVLKKQKLEGLFFKNLDEPASGGSSSYLKLIADAYSGLGYLLGLDGKFGIKNDFLKSINFYTYFAFSRSLYPNTSVSSSKSYSVYDSAGKINTNGANFFGLKVPFRYRLNLEMNMGKSPLSLKFKFPFISDPFFKEDFMGRSEDMNWFKYALDKDKLAEAKGPGRDSRYSWEISGSLRPNFRILKPWINSISLQKISTQFNFENKHNTTLKGDEKMYSPEREFFYPKNFTPKIKMSMSGTIFSTSMLNKKSKPSKAPDLLNIKNPFDETAEEEKEANKETKENKNKDKKNTDPKNDVTELPFLDVFIPQFKVSNANTKKWNNTVSYSLGYQLSAGFDEDLLFDYKNWKKPQDIKWDKIYSNFYKLYGSNGINSKLSYNGGFLSLNNSLDLKGNYQQHTNVKDVTEKNKLDLNNFKNIGYSIVNTNSFRITPFSFTKMFKPVYAEWRISEDLIRNKFDETSTLAKPRWKTEKIKWDKEYIKTHSVSAGLGFVFADYTQLITSSMNLSPLLQAYSWNGSFAFPYTKINSSVKFYEKDSAAKKWFWSPFKLSLNLSLPYNVRVSQSYTYNIEDKDHDNYNLSIAWKSLSARYDMSRKMPYKLVKDVGWKADGTEKKFIPSSLSLNASSSSWPIEFYFWKNRIKLNLSFSSMLKFDLIKITDSYFSFDSKISLKIHKFLELSFSSSSYNKSIARYFQNIMGLPEIRGEKNILKDLAQSFYFWDPTARRNSGFKLRSLNFSLSHQLKDWTLKFSYSTKPVLKKDAKPYYYTLVPNISFVVQWTPIGDIKVQAKKDDKKFSLDRGEIK